MSQKLTPFIALENVGVKYKKRTGFFTSESHWPLRDISFELYPGETLGIIGKNGVGKSTLLRLLAGIIGPDTGAIKRSDISVLLLAIRVGFQPHLTGRENAVLSGILLGMTERQVNAVMNDIIEFAELEQHIDDLMGTYSTGMSARLGFAVAVQAQPDVLLLDEVLGVGDRSFRQKSRDYMLTRIGTQQTVVMVSHDEALLRQQCSKVIWLEHGSVKKIGISDSVIDSYVESS